jgi:hypothetical protein
VDRYSNARVETSIVDPPKVEATEERVTNFNPLQHFTESVSADNRLNPRWLTVGRDGTVYAS